MSESIKDSTNVSDDVPWKDVIDLAVDRFEKDFHRCSESKHSEILKKTVDSITAGYETQKKKLLYLIKFEDKRLKIIREKFAAIKKLKTCPSETSTKGCNDVDDNLTSDSCSVDTSPSTSAPIESISLETLSAYEDAIDAFSLEVQDKILSLQNKVKAFDAKIEELKNNKCHHYVNTKPKYSNCYDNTLMPPFAKTFYPTSEEFSNPFDYVETIKNEGRHYGVIKIVPPTTFNPPFSLSRDLMFKPRCQRLSMTDTFIKEHRMLRNKLKKFYSYDPTKTAVAKFGGVTLNLALFFLAVDDHDVRNLTPPKSYKVCPARGQCKLYVKSMMEARWMAVANDCKIDPKYGPALEMYYYTVVSKFRAAVRMEQLLRLRYRRGLPHKITNDIFNNIERIEAESRKRKLDALLNKEIQSELAENVLEIENDASISCFEPITVNENSFQHLGDKKHFGVESYRKNDMKEIVLDDDDSRSSPEILSVASIRYGCQPKAKKARTDDGILKIGDSSDEGIFEIDMEQMLRNPQSLISIPADTPVFYKSLFGTSAAQLTETPEPSSKNSVSTFARLEIPLIQLSSTPVNAVETVANLSIPKSKETSESSTLSNDNASNEPESDANSSANNDSEPKFNIFSSILSETDIAEVTRVLKYCLSSKTIEVFNKYSDAQKLELISCLFSGQKFSSAESKKTKKPVLVSDVRQPLKKRKNGVNSTVSNKVLNGATLIPRPCTSKSNQTETVFTIYLNAEGESEIMQDEVEIVTESSTIGKQNRTSIPIHQVKELLPTKISAVLSKVFVNKKEGKKLEPKQAEIVPVIEKTPQKPEPLKPSSEPNIRRSSRMATAAAVKKISTITGAINRRVRGYVPRPKKPKEVEHGRDHALIVKLSKFLPTGESKKAAEKSPSPKLKRSQRKRSGNGRLANSTPNKASACKSSDENKLLGKFKTKNLRKHFATSRRYSLRAFRDEMNQFKAEFFNVKNSRDVDIRDVENAFWKNVGNIHSELYAFYGADLTSKNFGSGFPLQPRKKELFDAMTDDQKFYAKHPWNLNNMPVATQSVFHHLEENISGMTIPWVYVGSCFSLFCWHVEDHWTYSINYMHEGETKVWYGVPESDAAKFDALMHRLAPEMSEEYPDLMHHMSTMIHPSILMEHGIKTYTVHQNVGEIVITFPRAYHGGFNAGYNVAEAVNFAPYDWLAQGRRCLQSYSEVGRGCVFAHDDLIVSMLRNLNDVNPNMILPICKELSAMILRDNSFRHFLHTQGFKFLNPMISLGDTLFNEDISSCVVCNTLLRGCAVMCKHMRISCPVHFRRICKKCSPDELHFATSTPPRILLQMIKSFVSLRPQWRDVKQYLMFATNQLKSLKSSSSIKDLKLIMDSRQCFYPKKYPFTKVFNDYDKAWTVATPLIQKFLLNHFEESNMCTSSQTTTSKISDNEVLTVSEITVSQHNNNINTSQNSNQCISQNSESHDFNKCTPTTKPCDDIATSTCENIGARTNNLSNETVQPVPCAERDLLVTQIVGLSSAMASCDLPNESAYFVSNVKDNTVAITQHGTLPLSAQPVKFLRLNIVPYEQLNNALADVNGVTMEKGVDEDFNAHSFPVANVSNAMVNNQPVSREHHPPERLMPGLNNVNYQAVPPHYNLHVEPIRLPNNINYQVVSMEHGASGVIMPVFNNGYCSVVHEGFNLTSARMPVVVNHYYDCANMGYNAFGTPMPPLINNNFYGGVATEYNFARAPMPVSNNFGYGGVSTEYNSGRAPMPLSNNFGYGVHSMQGNLSGAPMSASNNTGYGQVSNEHYPPRAPMSASNGVVSADHSPGAPMTGSNNTMYATVPMESDSPGEPMPILNNVDYGAVPTDNNLSEVPIPDLNYVDHEMASSEQNLPVTPMPDLNEDYYGAVSMESDALEAPMPVLNNAVVQITQETNNSLAEQMVKSNENVIEPVPAGNISSEVSPESSDSATVYLSGNINRSQLSSIPSSQTANATKSLTASNTFCHDNSLSMPENALNATFNVHTLETDGNDTSVPNEMNVLPEEVYHLIDSTLADSFLNRPLLQREEEHITNIPVSNSGANTEVNEMMEVDLVENDVEAVLLQENEKRLLDNTELHEETKEVYVSTLKIIGLAKAAGIIIGKRQALLVRECVAEKLKHFRHVNNATGNSLNATEVQNSENFFELSEKLCTTDSQLSKQKANRATSVESYFCTESLAQSHVAIAEKTTQLDHETIQKIRKLIGLHSSSNPSSRKSFQPFGQRGSSVKSFLSTPRHSSAPILMIPDKQRQHGTTKMIIVNKQRRRIAVHLFRRSVTAKRLDNNFFNLTGAWNNSWTDNGYIYKVPEADAKLIVDHLKLPKNILPKNFLHLLKDALGPKRFSFDPEAEYFQDNDRRNRWLYYCYFAWQAIISDDGNLQAKYMRHCHRFTTELTLNNRDCFTLNEIKKSIRISENFVSYPGDFASVFRQFFVSAYRCGRWCESECRYYLLANQRRGVGFKLCHKFANCVTIHFRWLSEKCNNMVYKHNRKDIPYSYELLNHFDGDMVLYDSLRMLMVYSKKSFALRNCKMIEEYKETYERINNMYQKMVDKFLLNECYYKLVDILVGREDLDNLVFQADHCLPYLEKGESQLGFKAILNCKNELEPRIIQSNLDLREKLPTVVRYNETNHEIRSPCTCGVLIKNYNPNSLTFIRCMACSCTLHSSCVPYTPFIELMQQHRAGFYLCPRCLRSKRPNIENFTKHYTTNEDANKSVEYFLFKLYYKYSMAKVEHFLSLDFDQLTPDEFRLEANVILSSEFMHNDVYKIILNHPVYDNYFTEAQITRVQICQKVSSIRKAHYYFLPLLFAYTVHRKPKGFSVRPTIMNRKGLYFEIDEVECSNKVCFKPEGRAHGFRCITKNCLNFQHFACSTWDNNELENFENYQCENCISNGIVRPHRPILDPLAKKPKPQPKKSSKNPKAVVKKTKRAKPSTKTTVTTPAKKRAKRGAPFVSAVEKTVKPELNPQPLPPVPDYLRRSTRHRKLVVQQTSYRI